MHDVLSCLPRRIVLNHGQLHCLGCPIAIAPLVVIRGAVLDDVAHLLGKGELANYGSELVCESKRAAFLLNKKLLPDFFR